MIDFVIMILQPWLEFFAQQLIFKLFHWKHMGNYLASGSTVGEDDMIIGDESVEIVLDDNLQQQITNAIDSRFLVQLVGSFDTYCYFENHFGYPHKIGDFFARSKKQF